MKKFTAISLALVMILALMAGCTRGNTESTQPTTDPTQASTGTTEAPTQPTTMPTEPTQAGSAATTTSAQILGRIWTQYGENERFASYGGTVEHSLSDTPGDLDMTNTEEITSKYLLPADQLSNVESGASLVHLMNSNIFTAAAFQLKDGADVRDVAKALRDNIQKTQWLCGQPDHLLVADVDGHLLMAFAEKGAMDTFKQKLNTVYAEATIIYDEAVTA
ncbi:MAG: hypothetical protein IJZ15_04860 [Oscillospiraceae bacterium]|nr:hypothetical protein [Oscillospiraceae bacterium]